MNTGSRNTRSILLLSVAALALAACASERREPAPVVYRTESPTPAQRPQPQPSAAPSEAPAPIPSGQADSRGVVYYDGYETIRARANDTVESMAARVGVTGSELAAYNGLSTQYVPREGDELVLPARASGAGTETVLASADPGDYRPSAPEVAAAGAAGGDGEWSADLAREAIGGGGRDSGISSTPVDPPVAVERPERPERPEPQETAAATPPASDEPAAAASPPPSSGSSGFVRPVDAGIARPFSRSPGPDRNDGVDFATQAGDPVRAASSGTVALISESLGGLGTIVLIRHDNEYLTVYGRVDDVSVAKGDRVERGQVIAKVADLAPPQSPSLHYEVRRGAESIDPSPYL